MRMQIGNFDREQSPNDTRRRRGRHTYGPLSSNSGSVLLSNSEPIVSSALKGLRLSNDDLSDKSCDSLWLQVEKIELPEVKVV